MMPKRMIMSAGLLLVLSPSIGAQAAQTQEDAGKLYEAADQVVAENVAANIMCPANSSIEDFGYPYSEKWLSMEKADYAANSQARVLARQARSVEFAEWPAYVQPNPDASYLNHLRELSNDLADAAVWEHLQGEDAAAVETIKDLLHLADLLKNPADKKLERLLASIGVQAVAMVQLDVTVSGAVLTNDPTNQKNFSSARPEN
jgi:hypothetical protein